MTKKKIIVLTGAGVSAESGIKTFRDSDGLWENYRVEDVATYDAWLNNPSIVLDFYNQRRRQLATAQPNKAHYALASLEQKFDVQIITQNVDDLHERAGSTKVLHLHGELIKARSTMDDDLIYTIGYKDINSGDCCEKGHQLRPHIVWFGEAVPMIEPAAMLTSEAEILLIIGTSLMVYPAAGLLHYAPPQSQKFVIDPKSLPVQGVPNLTIIQKNAGEGVSEVAELLLKEYE